MTARKEPTWVRCDRAGFTLLELTVSAAVMSVILLALGSTMLIAGRALPQARSVTSSTLAAAEAADRIAAELRYATAVNRRSAPLIEFTVPDRNGDKVPETIRYEWSGAAGAPLTRQYNAGSSVEVLPDVREFDLSYETEAISREVPQGNESPETLLVEYTSTTDYFDYSIKSGQWFAQYFLPTLPSDTLGWKVTRVRFQGMQAGDAAGETRIQLQQPTVGGVPSGIVLEEKTLYESSLPLSYQPYEVAFENVSGLASDRGICLVFKWVSDAEACRLLGQDKNVAGANLSLGKSTDNGASWSTLAAQSLLFSVYGTVTTAGTPQIQNTYYLDAVRIRLRAGDDSSSLVQTAARMCNRPEVSQ